MAHFEILVPNVRFTTFSLHFPHCLQSPFHFFKKNSEFSENYNWKYKKLKKRFANGIIEQLY